MQWALSRLNHNSSLDNHSCHSLAVLLGIGVATVTGCSSFDTLYVWHETNRLRVNPTNKAGLLPITSQCLPIPCHMGGASTPAEPITSQPLQIPQSLIPHRHPSWLDPKCLRCDLSESRSELYLTLHWNNPQKVVCLRYHIVYNKTIKLPRITSAAFLSLSTVVLPDINMSSQLQKSWYCSHANSQRKRF